MHEQTKKQELLQLVKEHERIIFKICNTYCANRDHRPDLAQEIVYHLLKSYPRYDNSYKFSTWMYRIALNVAISFYRKTKASRDRILFVENPVEIADNISESVELEKDIRTLQQFINALKELDKALMLLYLEEKNYKEIGEILGITETNVATRIGRIKEKLKQQFLKVK